MDFELTDQQKRDQTEFRVFADREVAPHADRWDREERLPLEELKRLARRGYLGASIPADFGGAGMDPLTYGLLHEAIGHRCSSLRSAMTVHDMVGHAIARWGSPAMKARWLPKLAAGDAIAAFGLTEPNVGSDAKSIETTAKPCGDSYVLNGRKAWITFGAIADLFLIFTRSENGPAAFIVERDAPGLSIHPISGMLGVRASMLADIHLQDTRISQDQLVGRVGFGISHVASSALDLGRYSVAWGCVGIAQACLDASLQYASERRQFGSLIGQHQLIQQMITAMVTTTGAARLVCCRAGQLRARGDLRAIMETAIAKYFASTTAFRVASDAVQIHGAAGCSSAFPVQRYLRDAKIMEIIEGSTQIQETTIAQYAFQEQAARRPSAGAADRPASVEPVKCVIWDLDNTLWTGVLMEDDLVTLRAGAVEVIAALDRRGILQSVASKNDHATAMARLGDFGLSDYFLYPQIHWGSKAASVEAIARAINIGLDAVALVDDQAFERAEVRLSHPVVRSYDGADLMALLDLPEMNPRFVTDESRHRRQMYLSDQNRHAAEESFGGPTEAFLSTLDMRFAIARAREEDLHRAEELTVRTHQLNSSGRTYSLQELDRFRQSPQHELLVARLDDRFGGYGTIGLALVECVGRVWTINLLLTSCRVISRGVGSLMLNCIIERAKAHGAALRADYVPNDVNRMMYVTYKFAGFREVDKRGDLVALEHDPTRTQPCPPYVQMSVEPGLFVGRG